jgi:hypothetical protein
LTRIDVGRGLVHALLGVSTTALLLACGASSSDSATGPSQPAGATAGMGSTASSTTDQTIGMPRAAIDLKAIRLGTGKGSAQPKTGYLDRCGGVPSGGPPVQAPPWVDNSAHTWDATRKRAVRGDVRWHSSFTARHVGSKEVLSDNGLPPRSGTFPVSRSDPAYAYNPDPTAVSAHTVKVTLPYNPSFAGAASCEPGVIGVAVNGIPILDAFDAGGNDAAAVETQDTCHGHPNQGSGYHYHSLSPCLLNARSRTHATLVGWALDGFGIYVEYDRAGRLLTNSQLDGCHGRVSRVPWHGHSQRVYHYDMTFEFPYAVGCFRGTQTGESTITPHGPPA